MPCRSRSRSRPDPSRASRASWGRLLQAMEHRLAESDSPSRLYASLPPSLPSSLSLSLLRFALHSGANSRIFYGNRPPAVNRCGRLLPSEVRSDRFGRRCNFASGQRFARNKLKVPLANLLLLWLPATHESCSSTSKRKQQSGDIWRTYLVSMPDRSSGRKQLKNTNTDNECRTN